MDDHWSDSDHHDIEIMIQFIDDYLLKITMMMMREDFCVLFNIHLPFES